MTVAEPGSASGSARELAGRAALVVGTGPSIGGACVRALAAAGANVACFDVNPGAADRAAASVRSLGVSGLALTGDATIREQVRGAVAMVVAEMGSLDILVNVVGGSRWSLSADTSDEEWAWVMRANLEQQWIVAQEALPHLRAQGGGAIVCIASVSAYGASTNHGAYGAAKAGLVSLVKTLAVENAASGVRVNALAPGTIQTAARADDDELAVKVPLGRRGEPDEIASAALFLASDRASYVTGEVLVVDGGVSSKHSLVALDG